MPVKDAERIGGYSLILLSVRTMKVAGGVPVRSQPRAGTKLIPRPGSGSETIRLTGMGLTAHTDLYYRQLCPKDVPRNTGFTLNFYYSVPVWSQILKITC